MLIVCWSVKGGSGTTVVAAALSLLFAGAHRAGALAVDLDGDLAAALGVTPPSDTGLGDWLSADESVGGHALSRLATPAGAGLDLLARGRASDPASARWAVAADALAGDARIVVADAGTGRPPAPLTDAAPPVSVIALSLCNTPPAQVNTSSGSVQLANTTSVEKLSPGTVAAGEPAKSTYSRVAPTAARYVASSV